MDEPPDAERIREKLILAGLYLSRFDKAGLDKLGFEGFTEAFNVIGYALGSKPASVKNYRDEFDPLVPNPRKGWRNRPIRAYCLQVYEQYRDLDFESFTDLVKSFVEPHQTVDSDDSESPFAKRLITGLAAEQYFESIYSGLPEFSGCSIENTTRLGCGYDFRLRRRQEQSVFLAVEVKGLRERSGAVSLTNREYSTAVGLRDRFYLFVVKNFHQKPYHAIFQDPASGSLQLRRTEQIVVQVSWLMNV